MLDYALAVGHHFLIFLLFGILPPSSHWSGRGSGPASFPR